MNAEVLLRGRSQILVNLSDILIRRIENVPNSLLQFFCTKLVALGLRKLRFEDWDGREEFVNFREWLPANKYFKLSKSDGNLRLMVSISKLLWIFLVKLGGEGLVWVYLKGKSFRNG